MIYHDPKDKQAVEAFRDVVGHAFYGIPTVKSTHKDPGTMEVNHTCYHNSIGAMEIWMHIQNTIGSAAASPGETVEIEIHMTPEGPGADPSQIDDKWTGGEPQGSA